MARTVFRGGRVFDGSATLAAADVVVEDGRIVDVGPAWMATRRSSWRDGPSCPACSTATPTSWSAPTGWTPTGSWRRRSRTGSIVAIENLRRDARHRHHHRARRRLRRPGRQDGRRRRPDRRAAPAHRDDHPLAVGRPRRRLAAVGLRPLAAQLAGHAVGHRRRTRRDASPGPRDHPRRRRPDQGLHLGRRSVATGRPAPWPLPGRGAGGPRRGGDGRWHPGHGARAGGTGYQGRRASGRPEHRARHLPRRRGHRDDARARARGWCRPCSRRRAFSTPWPPAPPSPLASGAQGDTRSSKSIAAAVRRAIEAGVKVAMGTDSGVTAHGQNLRELALMVECGMTPVAGDAGHHAQRCRAGRRRGRPGLDRARQARRPGGRRWRPVRLCRPGRARDGRLSGWAPGERGGVMGEIQTVLGRVAAESLGVTLPHEHTRCVLWQIPNRWDYWQLTGDEELMTAELARFRRSAAAAWWTSRSTPSGGIRHACGAWPASGLHLVMGCGWYRQAYYPPRRASGSARSTTWPTSSSAEFERWRPRDRRPAGHHRRDRDRQALVDRRGGARPPGGGARGAQDGHVGHHARRDVGRRARPAPGLRGGGPRPGADRRRPCRLVSGRAPTTRPSSSAARTSNSTSWAWTSRPSSDTASRAWSGCSSTSWRLDMRSASCSARTSATTARWPPTKATATPISRGRIPAPPAVAWASTDDHRAR